MSADLRGNTMIGRLSLVVMDDCLVKLEHGRSQDRVRKFMFDSVESVVIWRRVPWVRVIVCAVCLVLPGAGLLFLHDTAGRVFGAILLGLGLPLVAFYLIRRSTTIRIVRGGAVHDISGVFRAKRVRRLRDRLIAGIEYAQAAAGASPGEAGAGPVRGD